MKYHIIVGLLFLLSTNGIAQHISKSKVRSLYYRAVTDEDAAEKLIKILRPYNSKKNPLLVGYRASGIMLMARHAFNPFKKLKYF